MSYYYESLNDQTFQKLAQALVVTIHPETVCLPVRQPDGGRDAFFYRTAVERKNFVVFQIKFSSNPKGKTERDAIQSLINSEKNKVKSLIDKGATHYYLVTNVQGTAHLDSGSIDKVNATLTKAFGIPSYVWWRDDLDARLDNASDIKWSYPEICRATDVLQFLIERPDANQKLESTRAITAYMGKQHGDDRDVKFKQVELKKRVTDLFVDVPIGHKISRRGRKGVQSNVKEVREAEEYLDQLHLYDDFESEDDELSIHRGLAASFLLHMPYGRGVSRFVLEGAPGQGKSTVTQFLCQVNRLKLLPARRSELGSVQVLHTTAATRTPFRVDLRDYAAWVAGRHPYAKEGEVAPTEEGQRSLESFLAMQIAWHSGGLNITQHDVLGFFVRAHSVVILDGFDEVADISTRARVVEEICASADRLDAHALSLQIVVTSRPAAFVNSPGFPEDDWIHLELKDLKWRNIVDYKSNWSKAQDLTPAENNALTATLKEKLQQPHLRDLSRNPMQLAILLQLMHMQGAALPDKRTALYEEYMKIFLNREVEKKQIAGDQRELILSIHGVLAWVLQVQAETGQGAGRITMKALRAEVSEYLASEEHDQALAESILKGTVERVGALVSRVQGTFEFEVQPLREYFAARHLHKTAPYSPPGSEKKGTRPDRFSTLARSSYWTNVTRFFCGFYDVGELPSLVDGLVGIGNESGYHLISQPRRLAMMLLGDYVFTQSPKSMRRLIRFITEEAGFQRLTGADITYGQRDMRLPELAGGKLLFEVCALKLREEEDPSLRRALRQIMSRNANRENRKAFWLNEYNEGTIGDDLLAELRDLDIVSEFSVREIEKFASGNIEIRLRWLAEANLHSHIVSDKELYAEACRAYFNYELGFAYQRPLQVAPINPLIILTEFLHPHILAENFSLPPEIGIEVGRRRYFRQNIFEHMVTGGEGGQLDKVWGFARFVVELMDVPIEKWKTDLSLWDRLVNRGFLIAPGGRLFSLIAMISTAASDALVESEDIGETREDEIIGSSLKSDEGKTSLLTQAFAPTPGLVRRLCFAKSKRDDQNWWRSNLEVPDVEARITCIAGLVRWSDPEVVESLSDELGAALEKMDEKSWSWLWNLYSLIPPVSDSQRAKLDDGWLLGNGNVSDRVAILLSKRLAKEENRRDFVRKHFYDYVGHDPRILRTAIEWELLSEPNEKIDWEFVIRLSTLARANGVGYLTRGARKTQPFFLRERLRNAFDIVKAEFDFARPETTVRY